MKNGKFAKRGVSTKAFAMILAIVALVSVTVGGTLAWLTDDTNAVENTFTATDIEVTLVETKGLNEDGKWENEMIPGYTYEKNPIVTITEKTTVDCYLFVKFEETEDASKYLTYTSLLNTDNGWTELGDGVWYRVVKTTDDVKSWHLLENDKVTVNADNVTKDTMEVAAATKLTYTAYAHQLMKNAESEFTAAEAWNLLNG